MQSYLVVFSTLGIVLRWSVGVKLLSLADEPANPPPTILPTNTHAPIMSPQNLHEAHMPLLDSEPASATTLYSSSSDGAATPPAKRRPSRKSDVFNSFPNTPHWGTPAGSRPTSVGDEYDEEEEEADSDGNDREDGWGGIERGSLGSKATSKPPTSKASSQWAQVKRGLKRWVWRPLVKIFVVIKSFMTVPLCVGQLLALV